MLLISTSRQPTPGKNLLGAVLSLICDKLKAEIALLKAKDAQAKEFDKRRGEAAPISLPGGCPIGLHQPGHETALKFEFQLVAI